VPFDFVLLCAEDESALAVRRLPLAQLLKQLEQASLKRSLDNLKTFPFVRAARERNALALFGAYFDVATGELSVLEQESGRFVAARD